nr:CobW domain-containing protein 2 [Karlodinium veneficum]
MDSECSQNGEESSRSRTPVTILSGALGSGKTTLLKYILEKPHGFRVAVIQNEFSEEMGIESPLITDSKGDSFKGIVELPNGCLCCSAKDGLISALDNLLEGQKRFDYVLVEATGVADPEAICEIFWVDDGLGSRVYLDGVVTLVDGHNAMSALDGKEASGSGGDAEELGLEAETSKQVACADVLVLNKCDLAAQTDRARISERLRRMNPAAKQLESTYAVVSLESILGIRAFDRHRIATQIADLALPEAGHGDGHGHDNGHGHDSEHMHGHDSGYDGNSSERTSVGHSNNGHTVSRITGSRVTGHRGIESYLLRGPDSPSALFDPDKVEKWMADVLWDGTAGGVYRCKGLFWGLHEDADEDEPMEESSDGVAYALQGVGRLFEIEEAPQVKEVFSE